MQIKYKLFGFLVIAINFISLSWFSGSNNVQAQIDDHTVREEAEGKIVWEKLKAKEVNCSQLSSENFEVLGEYFMGQMTGDFHDAMNNMMVQMMGEEGEEQMHVVMGKRLSSCDTLAAYPVNGIGFMPMMNMMTGGVSNMMNWGWGSGIGIPFFGWGGGLFMILWWVFIIVALGLIMRWLTGLGRGQASTKSALDILKERYAKGEINKQEFEDKKKDIV